MVVILHLRLVLSYLIKPLLLPESSIFHLKAGNVLSSDLFYTDDPLDHQMWAAYNVLCVEMEAAGLYSIAAKHDVNALAILTISDSLITGEKTSAQERETTFNQMIKIALELAD